MLKKLIKYSLWTISVLIFCSVIFLYLVYFGENRFSIMLNQGLTSLPTGLQDVSVEKRRGLYCILTNYDANTISKCHVDKQNLTAWLGHAKFEVIYFLPKGDSVTKFYSSFDSLPKSITQNDIGYSIQIEAGNGKKISVDPLNDNEVNLQFFSDWN